MFLWGGDALGKGTPVGVHFLTHLLSSLIRSLNLHHRQLRCSLESERPEFTSWFLLWKDFLDFLAAISSSRLPIAQVVRQLRVKWDRLCEDPKTLPGPVRGAQHVFPFLSPISYFSCVIAFSVLQLVQQTCPYHLKLEAPWRQDSNHIDHCVISPMSQHFLKNQMLCVFWSIFIENPQGKLSRVSVWAKAAVHK